MPDPLTDAPDLAPLIDHALLDPRQGSEAVQRCCKEALHHGFAGVCLASRWMPQAREWLGARGPTRLVSVIGFPFGAVAGPLKRAEAEWAAEHGAEELDVVPDFALLLDGRATDLHDELAAIVELGLPVKLILESAQLEAAALETLVEVGLDAGVAFLKTGTGLGPAATPTDVARLRELARGRCAIKASGGIRDLEGALALVEAGATRLGTSRGGLLVEAQRRAGRRS
ncbi:MAG: deoxyribose-phosphate aldolase [Prochlorococcaceae cyanobacterium]